jgi:hypothetical protein
MDSIYTAGPMMVKMAIMPQITSVGRRYWFEQTRDSQDLSETPEEFEQLLRWVKDPNRPPGPESTELVEDDPFIKRRMKSLPSTTGVCIVTDDVALCREAAALTHLWVIRVPVKWYYMDTYFGEGNQPWLERVKSAYPLYEWITIEDSGSIKSYEEVGFRDGNPLKWPQVRPFSMLQTAWRNGRRVRAGASKVPFEDDFEWKPYGFPKEYLFTYSNLPQRKKHPYRRGWA